jgi:membrane protein required for colicin V production
LHPLDIALAAVLLYGTYRGYRTGLVLVLVNSVALILAVSLAFLLLDESQMFLKNYLSGDSFFLPLTAFFLVFFLVFWGLRWFAGFASAAIVKSMLSPLNQAGGALFGLMRMAIILGSVLTGLSIIGIRPEEKCSEPLWLLPILRDTGIHTMGILVPLLPFLRSILEKR